MNLSARHTILIDATATTATAVLMLAARSVLYPYFGLASPELLDIAAAAFIVYAGVIGLAAARPDVSKTTLVTIAGANVAYVVASMIVLVMFWSGLAPAGRALIVGVALAVEAFAFLQFTAARRLPTVRAA
ncbi:MAG TPA: hypothetical protein VFP85_05225 [Vicinamibacterales bacterium]|nr:hypothetical protein [Vicinamibacterales bacterium]